jgi:hypothetical protein
MPRVFYLVATLAAATVVTLPAQVNRTGDFSCDDVGNNRRLESFCEIREEMFSGNAIDVDASPNGGIRVIGWDRNDIQVRTRVVASARTEQEARNLAGSVTVTTTGGRVRADGPENRRDEEWWVSFEVRVPGDGRVSLSTRNGGISILDFRGTARFDARNGGVSLANVNGDIRGETVNGGINVDLAGDRWDGTGLDVETRNGGVRMSIPANYSAQLETETVNGGLRIDFPVTFRGNIPTGRTRRIATTLGSGGAPIRVATTNGGITIRER